MHLLGPKLIADWKSLGVPCSRPDEVYLRLDSLFEPRGSEPAIARALLIPMPHYYGNEEFRTALGLTLEDEHAEHPIRGVKLHLASAGFRFDDAEHVAALSNTVCWAHARDLLVLLHLDPQRHGLVTAHLRRRLDEVFGPLPSMRVVITHVSGSGGFGPWPRSVLETIATWLDSEQAAGRPRREFFVDLSTVPLIRESEGHPPSTDEEISALAPAVRRLGIDHVLFASDYPVFDPRDQAVFLRERCGLTEDELTALFAAPIL